MRLLFLTAMAQKKTRQSKAASTQTHHSLATYVRIYIFETLLAIIQAGIV